MILGQEKEQMDYAKKMGTQMLKITLEAMAENASQLAVTNKKVYDELVKAGFTDQQALQIVCSVGIGGK